MPYSIKNPVNKTQRRFNELCALGGGVGGGPARTKVQELLQIDGGKLNVIAAREIRECLAAYPDRNPWHVCFAVSLCWGHLAAYDLTFVDAASSLLDDWNSEDLKVAKSFAQERGPEPIAQSLSGAFSLFQKVRLPKTLPNTLEQYTRAQERWLSPIVSPDRPPYIGSWNATGMFMVGILSDPALTASFTERAVMLPPGGPIYQGLMHLYSTNIIRRAPSGSELDDESFEPGSIYENNALFEEVQKGRPSLNLVDEHSGLYLLGTKLKESDRWYD